MELPQAVEIAEGDRLNRKARGRLPTLSKVALGREWGRVYSGGAERDARAAPAHEELRRSVRFTDIAVGTLACDQCDAPVAIGDTAIATRDQLTCPYCQHRAPARDFLSLAAPTRPTRVVVRVRRNSRRLVS